MHPHPLYSCVMLVGFWNFKIFNFGYKMNPNPRTSPEFGFDSHKVAVFHWWHRDLECKGMSNPSAYLPRLLRTFWCAHGLCGKYMFFEMRNVKFYFISNAKYNWNTLVLVASTTFCLPWKSVKYLFSFGSRCTTENYLNWTDCMYL